MQNLNLVLQKKHRKFNNTKETSFATYQIITGADQGKYMRVMGNRSAAAFDTEEELKWPTG